MCFGLGLPCCIALIEFLPYIFLVNMPIIGSFYGVETVYRISILLIIHSLLVEFFPQFLFRIVPLFSLLIFIGLINLPISLTPYPVIWFYDKVIWLTEPLLMIAEVILVQNFVMRKSQHAADEIDREDGESTFFYKAGILIFSASCYGLAASFVYDIYYIGSQSQIICLFVVLFIIVALHNMMLMAHEGIISDCAFCTLLNVYILLIMIAEADRYNSPHEKPQLWSNGKQSSVVNIAGSIINMDSTTAQKSIRFLKKFVNAMLLFFVAVRLYSIIFIVNKATKNFYREETEHARITDEEYDREVFSPWKSPLLLKISIIFILTQFTINYLNKWTGHTRMFWLMDSKMFEWASKLIISRLLQILAVSIFYMWRLYKADDWSWNSWLT